MSKILRDDLAVGQTMQRRRHIQSDDCPLCGFQPETIVDMLTCPKARSLQQDLVYHLQQWLEAHQTDPAITTFVIDSLRQWFAHPEDPLSTFSSDPVLSLAFTTQSTLECFALLCGYISKHIIAAQALYYVSISSKCSATKWGSNLIKQLWNILFQLWSYWNTALHKTEKFILLVVWRL